MMGKQTKHSVRNKMTEKNLDFDTIWNRRNTDCYKYDLVTKDGLPEDVLPLWVADMDFCTSSYVEDALQEVIGRGIYCYSDKRDSYFQAVAGWMQKRHNYRVEKDWLVKTPGVVYALGLAVRVYTEPGEAVLIQRPVYAPFTNIIRQNHRKVVINELKEVPGADGGHRYEIDFDDLEQKIRDNHVKLMLLCNPHNPVGRVWTKEELTRIAEICKAYDVIVASDEIHNDFIFQGEHTVFSTISEDAKNRSIVCTAPSKTFNLAMLMASNTFIANAELRKKFLDEMDAQSTAEVSYLGQVACETAYRYGDVWYEAMLQYVRANQQYVYEYVSQNLPGVKAYMPEGTYLMWLDFRGLGLTNQELNRRIREEAKLWFNDGRSFGEEGEGFQRVNVACPRSVVEEAMERLKKIL